MKNNLAKISLLTLLAAAIIAVPVATSAQDNNAGAKSETAPAKAKKKDSLVFRGAVKTVDATAMTFTVGERTFNVTSETKITKNGQPAVLSDVTAGETVAGAYKKGADGKLNATTVKIGAKGEGKGKKKDTGSTDAK
jgi:hypothetical protein